MSLKQHIPNSLARLLRGLLLAHMFAVISGTGTSRGQPRITHYSVDQGLSQSSVRCIARDSFGFMWFGTGDGLNRFDGLTFMTFHHLPDDSRSIPDDGILSMVPDSGGILWVGTNKGLVRYDPSGPGFVPLANDPGYAGAPLGGRINDLLLDSSGKIWIGCGQGVWVLNPATGNIIDRTPEIQDGLPTRQARLLMEDGSGGVWVSFGDALYRYPAYSRPTRITLPSAGSGRDVAAVWTGGGRKLYVGTLGAGLMEYDSLAGTWTTYLQSNPRYNLFDNHVKDIEGDGSGTVWVGTRTGGLCFLDRTMRTLERYELPDQIASGGRFESAGPLLLDDAGLLWAAYDGSGFLKIATRKDKFRLVRFPRTRDEKMTGENFLKPVIVDHRGRIWLGTFDRGIVVLDSAYNPIRRYLHAPGDPGSISGNSILALCEGRDGTIWVGTSQGLDSFDPRVGRFRRFRVPVAGRGDERASIVTAIHEAGKGTLWVGTITSLYRIGRQDAGLVPVGTIPFRIETISSGGDGSVWIGTFGDGLVRTDSAGSVIERHVHEPGSRNSLSNNTVKTLCFQGDSVLWAGTESGLNRLDLAGHRWKTFTVRDGLSNDFIYGALMDDRGRLWISTNKGISSMETASFDVPKIRNYTPEDGLQSYEFNTHSYFRSADGRMLFGGVNGLNVFDPDSLTDNPYVPPVVITAFRKAGQLVDLDAEVMTLRLLTLDHAESVFSFEFAALEYTQPLRNQYAYRMEGFDRDWVYCGTRREARYTNLDPGTYVFRVKAANNDGVWNPEPASITVVIVPPFWRTSLFVISSLVLSVLVLGAAIRYVSTRKLRMAVARLERQREISEERLRTRERIARDLHDDLASTVGSAGMYIELLRRQPGNGNSASLLERTASLLNDAKEAMADIVWSVSPRNDSVESLLARVSIHAADMCRAHGLKYEFDLPQEYPATVPDENLRRNVYLILKEAITNAVRHSGAGRIRFFSAVSGESLFCEVSDDGKGVDPGAGEAPVRHSGGFGMDNMRRRASEIGAQFEVTSTPDRGTAVRLTVRMTQSGY